MKYSREEWHAHKFLTAKKELNVFKLVFLIFFELCQIPKQTILASGVRGNFSRGGGLKKKLNILSNFFLGRPVWFSELSEKTLRTLFCENFSRRRQFFFF